MKRWIPAILASLIVTAPVLAQDKRMTFGGGDDSDERASTWVMYFDGDTGRSTGGSLSTTTRCRGRPATRGNSTS